MTMQHQIHPDDERLAALAGGDPDVVADAELSAHVSGCTRCTDFVDELTTLRSALAELPDLVPSRRLQLIPPVAEPQAAASGGWLRRLAAPVMAAGFGFVLVGAVGTSGILNSAASSPMLDSVEQRISATDDAATPHSAELSGGAKHTPTVQDAQTFRAGNESARTTTPRVPGSISSSEEADTALGGRRDGEAGLFSTTDPRLPWLVILGLGVGLLLAGLFLRFNTQPRAG